MTNSGANRNDLRKRAEEIVDISFQLQLGNVNSATLTTLIKKALEDTRREEREATIKECAEIAQDKWQQHTGFAGDYDIGAASAAIKIRYSIVSLLDKAPLGGSSTENKQECKSDCLGIFPDGEACHIHRPAPGEKENA